MFSFLINYYKTFKNNTMMKVKTNANNVLSKIACIVLELNIAL